MNAARRKEIESARKSIQEAVELREAILGKLSDAKDILEQVKGDEEDYRNNMPESLQSSEKAERADAAVSALEEALEKLEGLEEAMNDLDELEGFLDTAAE